MRNWFGASVEAAVAEELNELLTQYLYHHNLSYPGLLIYIVKSRISSHFRTKNVSFT